MQYEEKNTENTIEILDKNDCCGCSSCAQKCPKNAIEMKENEEGFLYPIINKEKCINCGLCRKVCPQLKEIKKNNEGFPKVYALYDKDKDIQLNSSSGGVFSEIAIYVLKNNGIVYGASYDDKFNVMHTKIENENELDKLRKSKYVQSDINNTYISVEENLKSDRLVLFSGTPCQVNGLKTFLLKNYDNLITCDIVCHGVPSPKAFKQYLTYLSKKMKDDIEFYDFRCKDIEGCEKIGKVTTKRGKSKYLKIGLDCYYNNFLDGNIFRESCYQCHYSNINRVGDITIGDYIGVLQMQPEAYSKNGTSICIINTSKGEHIFNNIQNKQKVYVSDFKKISAYNSNLNAPKKRPSCRNSIYDNIDNVKEFIHDLKINMNKKVMLKSLVPIKLKNTLKMLRRK